MKKANFSALVLMSIILVSTLVIYVANNSTIFTSSSQLTPITNDKRQTVQSIENVISLSTSELMANGFSLDSFLWFENGAYVPTLNQVLETINQTMNQRLKILISEINNSVQGQILFDNLYINVREENERYFIIVEGIEFIDERENFFIREVLSLETEITEEIQMYKILKRWTRDEGTLTFENIANSFNATCGSACTCGQLTSQTQPESINEQYIVEQIASLLSLLNSEDYFGSVERVTCSYNIRVQDIKNNFGCGQSSGFSCTGGASTTLELSNSPQTFILDDSTSVVASSTVSYETQNFLYLGSNRTLAPPLQLNPRLLGQRNPTFSGLNQCLYSLQQGSTGIIFLKEPSVNVRVDITCKSEGQFYSVDGVSRQKQLLSGFRINVMKGCDISDPPVNQVTSCTSFCQETAGCDIFSGAESCIPSNANPPPSDPSVGGDICSFSYTCLGEILGVDEDACNDQGGFWLNPIQSLTCLGEVTFEGCCSGNWEQTESARELTSFTGTCENGIPVQVPNTICQQPIGCNEGPDPGPGTCPNGAINPGDCNICPEDEDLNEEGICVGDNGGDNGGEPGPGGNGECPIQGADDDCECPEGTTNINDECVDDQGGGGDPTDPPVCVPDPSICASPTCDGSVVVSFNPVCIGGVPDCQEDRSNDCSPGTCNNGVCGGISIPGN